MLKVKMLEVKIKSRIKKTRLSSKVQMFNFRGGDQSRWPLLDPPLPSGQHGLLRNSFFNMIQN